MLKRIEHFGWISVRRGRAVSGALAVGALVLSAAVATLSQASPTTYSVLHKFTGGTDGFAPNDAAVDKAGNVYGVAEYGGNDKLCRSESGGPGCGTVYKIDSTGNFAVLHTFTGSPSDGEFPLAFVRDGAGNIYGTTYMGGAYSYGALYELDASGNETILHSFGGTKGDGTSPGGALIRDTQGNLYGGTSGGGTYGNGTLFELDASGNYTTLFSFDGTNGASPTSLLLDSAGNFYGTTIDGGAYLNGAVFELTASGQETVLYSFTGGADGRSPLSLLRDAAGDLYGSAYTGGAGCDNIGCGVIFEVSSAGVETVLHAFAGSPDGLEPNGLLMGPGNNLYGTTFSGGNGAGGTIFSVSLRGKENVVYDFPTGGADGSLPVAGLAKDAAGNLYGTTSQGGQVSKGTGYGVTFKFVP
jgi:uncharacterized repeat protein (TIGR03803 family)